MTSTPCPFCGELMDSLLRFCISCGRAVTPGGLSKVPLKVTRPEQQRRGPPGNTVRSMSLTRKNYDFHRACRTQLFAISKVLVIVLGYYCVMRFVLHEHMPGKIDVVVEKWIFSGHLMPPVVKHTSTAAAR